MTGRAGALAASVLALVVGCGCAKKLAPPGGKPDIEPPHVATNVPDSGSVNVPVSTSLTIGFSENMAHRDPEQWLVIGPYVPFDRARWSGRSVTVELSDSLRANQAYTLVISDAVTDTRGNRLRPARALTFTTGTAFLPGKISGRIEGRGHVGEGVFVWGYRADLGRAPDSTARDFDGLAVGGEGGRFSLFGLPVPSRWRLYAFYDANRTASFEPGIDFLTPLDSTIALTPDAPSADSLTLVSVDPNAAATAQGIVADTSGAAVVDTAGKSDPKLKIWVEPLDSTAAKKGPTTIAVSGGAFRFTLAAGRYRVRAFLDADQNGTFDAAREQAGEAIEIVAVPGGLLQDLRLAAPPGVSAGGAK